MDIQEIYPEDLEEYISQKNESDYLLVDVRRLEEYEAEHIPGAKLLPLSELKRRYYELPRDRELIFYCHSGWRSNLAAMFVKDRGFENTCIYNLIGGISAWGGEIVTGLFDLVPFRGSDFSQPLAVGGSTV